MKVEVVDDIRRCIFDKLLINCSINVVGALGAADCGQTIDFGEDLVRQLIGYFNH